MSDPREIEMARSVLKWIRLTPEERKADGERLRADLAKQQAEWDRAAIAAGLKTSR